MPIREKTLEELLDRIGVQYRPRVRKAIDYEEQKAVGKALAEWEEIVSEARREGKDVTVIQDHLKRLHQLWWQRGGPQGKEALPEAGKRAGSWDEQEGGENRDASYTELKKHLRTELQAQCIAEGVDLVSRSDENLLRIRSLLDGIIKERLKEIPHWVKRKDLMEEIMNEVLGLGVLEEYLKDPKVNEVMINGSDVYYEREGRIFEAPRGFASPEDVRQVIERIIHPIGRRVDESSPLVDGRLPDGSRVHVALPPCSQKGPCMTIRKFTAALFNMQELVRIGSLTPQAREFLEICVNLAKITDLRSYFTKQA